MLPVLDKPLVQYAVEEALEAGIEELIFVTGRGKSAIEDYFDGTEASERALSQPWIGRTRFQILKPPLEPGWYYADGRPTRAKKGDRPEEIWPETFWKGFTKEERNIAREKWAINKKRRNAGSSSRSVVRWAW